jgi:alkylated DNA repair dioxygenase AlkB
MIGVTYIPNFIPKPTELFVKLNNSVNWDTRMTTRKTASYGVAYNYSQINYPHQEMLPELEELCKKVNEVIGFVPNNCLINYYMDGKSKMGYHSDQIDILESDTGIVIISLGETRILRFKNISDENIQKDFELPSGSLVYMTQDVQKEWKHAIPPSETEEARMSLTFRRMISE